MLSGRQPERALIMERTIIVSVALLYLLSGAIAAFALTPQQVIELKKAGVSEKTIQMMIGQEEAAKASTTAIGVREIKDQEGNTAIIYTTGSSTSSAADDDEKKNVDRAWEMLRQMTIKPHITK